MNNKGQLSLEYVLVAMIGILLLTLISFPLVNLSIDNSNDIIDIINSKNELNKISDGINYCYYSGKGSKKLILLDFNKEVTTDFFLTAENKSIIKSKIQLNSKNGGDNKENNSNKDIIINSNAPVQAKSISFNKGFNKLLIEWSKSSNKIIVNKV